MTAGRESGYIGGIVQASRLSQATTHKIRPNLVFAFMYSAADVTNCRGWDRGWREQKPIKH